MKSPRSSLRVADVIDTALDTEINTLELESGLKVMNMEYAKFMTLRCFTEASIDFFWRTR